MTVRSFLVAGLCTCLSLSLAAHASAQAPAGPPPAYPAGPTTAPAPAPPVGYAPAPIAQPAYPPNAPPTYAPPMVAGPIVRLQVNNPRARLQQETQLRWVDLCQAPCGVIVNPNGTYRVGGGTLRATDPFRVPRASGVVLVDAHLGSKIKRGVGIGLTIGAGVAFASAAFYFLASPKTTATTVNGTTTKDVNNVIGIVELVTGGILAAVGISLIASGSTSVDVR